MPYDITEYPEDVISCIVCVATIHGAVNAQSIRVKLDEEQLRLVQAGM